MKRNYGIDVARIVAIWFVVLGHIVTCGGILPSEVKGQWPLCMIFLDCMTVGCVNVFGLISGYVGLTARHRLSSCVRLWLQVFLTNAIMSLFFALCSDARIDLRDVLFPVLRRDYWYFTAYIPLFFLMPILNEGIRKMSAIRCRVLCLILVGILSGSRLLVSQDPFALNGGYSFAWLLILYILGGCLNRSSLTLSKKACLFGFLGCVVTGCVAVLCFGRIAKLQSVFHGINPFYGYCSPLVVIGAILLLLGLIQYSKFFERFRSTISFFSASAFGVYLIHVQPLAWRRLFVGNFHFLSQLGGGGDVLRNYSIVHGDIRSLFVSRLDKDSSFSLL